MKNFRKKVVIFIAICVILLIIFVIAGLKNIRQKVEPFEPTLQDSLNSIEGICKYYNIELIDVLNSNDANFSKQIYLKFAYNTQNENGTSSRAYYEEVIQAFAKLYDYDNLILLDDEKALKIEIVCVKVSKVMRQYVINGDKNYFFNLESKINLSKITDVEIKNIKSESNILKSLIKNSWNENSVNFGTKDSTLDSYDIYFDEGIEVRKVGGKIFNLVFTDRYTNDVIEGVNTKTDLNAIKEKYGDSGFKNIGTIMGYKTNDFYIFFNGRQISIYRVESYDTTEFAKLVTEFVETKDQNKFIENLTKIWPDYDYLMNDTLRKKIEVSYILKGVKFNINVSLEHGVTLYSNFSGKITNDLTFEEALKATKNMPKYVYIKNEDLVLENEIKRAYGIHDPKSNYESYTYAYNDAKSKNLPILTDTTLYDFINQSSKFFCKNNENQDLRIFSRENEYAPAEIKKVYSFIWADDIHLIYSSYKKGIYMYNAITRQTNVIKEGNEFFKIKGYNNNSLEYDDTTIKCNID